MKPTAYLINIGRGAIVPLEPLTASLRSREIAGAALDVFETEPLPANHALWQMSNVIITPHTAFFSQASTLELETRTAQEVVRVINGGEPENFINPDVRGRTRVGI